MGSKPARLLPLSGEMMVGAGDGEKAREGGRQDLKGGYRGVGLAVVALSDFLEVQEGKSISWSQR